MKNEPLSVFYKIFLPFLIVVIFILSLVPRYFGAIRGLPDYAIAEVAVVGFSVAYMQGDLNPGWYQYGPLYSYLLSIVYFVVFFFLNIEFNDFVQNIFFNPSFFYFVARISSSVLSVLLATLVYFLTQRMHNKKVAVIALLISIFPFIENLTFYEVRIDILLAIWSLLVVYFAIKINKTEETRYYIITGLFVGLGFATKPLPALLVLPTILLSHFLIYSKLDFLKKIKNAFVNKKLFILIFSAIFFNFVFNPYSLIDFKNFIGQQIEIIGNDIYFPWPQGYTYLFEFTKSSFLGYCFIVLSVCAVFYYFYKYFKTKKSIYMVLVSYPVVFFSSFAIFPSFSYFFVPIIPFLVLMMSKLIVDISEKAHNNYLKGILVFSVLFLLLFQPGKFLFKQAIISKSFLGDKDSMSTVAGKRWIEENIPEMSKIFVYGKYPYLPRLVDYRMRDHMFMTDDLVYGLHEKESYRNSYEAAYAKIKQEDAVFFEIETHRNRPEEIEEARIFDYCLKNNFDYVITSYRKDLDLYPEFRKRKIKVFRANQFLSGNSFKIYQIK